MKQRIFGWISVLVGIVVALASDRGHGDRLALFRGWPLYAGGRAVRAHPEHLCAGCDQGHGVSLHRQSLSAPLRRPSSTTPTRLAGIPWVNNVGLFGPDFPTIKPADRYVVMLIGGSVASQLAQNQAPPAPRYLEEELNKKYVSPNGKPWMVLNGGDGAWKEPQPFILFSLYATSVDAMILVGRLQRAL